MKYIITLLALSLLAGATLHAQQHAAAIVALRATPDFSLTSSNAVALKDQVLAASAINVDEDWFANQVIRALNTPAEQLQAARGVLAGKGGLYSAGVLKNDALDSTGWTAPMIQASKAAAFYLAFSVASDNNPAFRQLVFDTLKTEPLAHPKWLEFFKSYRGTLSKPAQIEASILQKNALLGVVTRTTEQNAWLAEVSADIIALQLDQQPNP